jgi:hypothetical protein
MEAAMLEILGIGLAVVLATLVARARRNRARGIARGEAVVGGGDAFYDACHSDGGGCDGGGDGGGGGD